MRCADAARAAPDIAGNQAQTRLALGIDRHHGMQQHTSAHALADLTQTAGALARRAEIDLTGVLDRQDVPARNSVTGCLAPPCDQPPERHFAIAKKTVELHLMAPLAARQPAKTNTARMHHPFEERRPLFQGEHP